MIQFKSYLTEQEQSQGQKLKHLTHLEDYPIHYGHEGAAIAAQHLEDVHNKLLGKNNSINVSTKYDGAPSVVFGQHPENGQFFVATKGAFNKNPKLAFTHDDVEKHYGHAPGLAEKMHAALDQLPKIMPNNGGVYQGDLMYTKPDVQRAKGMYHFKPNTITYSAPQDSSNGKAIKNSELGVVVHTQYGGRGKDLASMSATPLNAKQRDKFNRHPDVNNIDPTININPSNYTTEEQRAYLNHMENAKRAYSKMKPEAMDALAGHGLSLEKHINQSVRNGTIPSVQGYMDSLTDAHNKDLEKVKTPAARDKRIQAHAATLKQISDNQEHFGKALELHGHLQAAKNVLTGVMAKNNPFVHSINGEPTGPEGAVAVDKQGNMSKFVDRNEFSRQNLLAGKFRKEQQPMQEAYEPSHVMTYMRANPPTAGHETVVNKVLDIAKQTGGSHGVILSHSQDASKNPLSPAQKLKHAKRAFPNANVEVASDDAPTILHHAAIAHNNGVQNFHVVVGQDRVGQFNKLLNDYNGKESKHGYYNFKSIIVHSAGDRDPDAEGVTGISGTKMRAAAKAGDAATFHSGASSAMSEKHRNDMMRDVQKGMTVKEETDTIPAADAPSVAELSARGSMESGGKKKKLKEETTTGSVGGLGFNTGNPAVDDEKISSYATTNALAQDDENGNLLNMMKKTQSSISNRIGFKAFDPTQKGKK